MLRKNEVGFSLIELILVMAITASLAATALVGQRALRSQAQFDAAINKIVATVNDARNEATAGVNIAGTGNGTVSPAGCANSTAEFTVFRGTAISFDNAIVNGPIKLDYYKATPGSEACLYESRVIGLASRVTVVGPGLGGRVLFIRNDIGGLSVCAEPNLAIDVTLNFKSGNCTGGIVAPITFSFKDADGHTSHMLVDESGLAKRLN